MKALIFAVSVILVILLAGCVSQVQNVKTSDAQPVVSKEILIAADGIKWSPAPASLPAGAQFVLLEGANLSAAEPFTFRLKMPKGYELKPHTHPAIEHVTVISGTLNFGTGNVFDKSKAKAYSAGSFISMPIGHAMFGFVDEETVIQVHSIGPWGIAYVNPADDPRKK